MIERKEEKRRGGGRSSATELELLIERKEETKKGVLGPSVIAQIALCKPGKAA